MGNNSSKPPPISKQEQEVFAIKTARDRVIQYQKKLTFQHSEADEAVRRKLSEGKRVEARAALRLKKRIWELLEEAAKQLEQLHGVLFAIEAAKARNDFINAVAIGTDTLKAMNKDIGGIERATKIMDEAGEAVADTEEISNVLASGGAVVDEDTIEADLKELEKEAENKTVESTRVEAISKGEPLPEVPTTKPMPNAPKEEPQGEESAKKEEERQMLTA